MPNIADALDCRGPDWRAWIVDNLRAGCSPVDMQRQMIADGWNAALAEHALLAAAKQVFPHLAPPGGTTPLPWIPPLGEVERLGRIMTVKARMVHPAVALCDNIVSPDECRQLIAYARERGISRSTVVDETNGQHIAHPERSSAGVMLRRAETDLIAGIETRLAALTRWPVDRGEGLQILRYGVGDEYRPHFDSFPDGAGGLAHTAHGGQRLNTIVVYLQAPDQGGGTSFPAVGLTLRPAAGEAVIFRNVDDAGKRDAASIHAGMPVERGEKIVLTYWQRAEFTG